MLLAWLLAAPGASGLTVLYTASLNGKPVGSGVGGQPRAGLAARAAWLRTLPNRSAAVLIDAGDVLAGTADRALSSEILEVYAELGYDAIAVGLREIAQGVDALSEYRDRFGLICQNLAICSSRHCLFFTPEPLLLEKEGMKIGLFALLAPKTLAAFSNGAATDIKLVPPELLAGSLVSQLAGQGAEWILVLYYGPAKEAEALARRVRGIDLIVVGSEGRPIPPRKAGDTLVTSLGGQGDRLGILDLSRDEKGRIRYSHRYQLFGY